MGAFEACLVFIPAKSMLGADLSEIKQRGVLRQLGVPYAKFVSIDEDGLDTELS